MSSNLRLNAFCALLINLFCFFIPSDTVDAGKVLPLPPQQIEYPSGGSHFKTIRITGIDNDWALGGSFGMLKNVHGKTWEGLERISQGVQEFLFVANDAWSAYWGAPPESSQSESMTGKAAPMGGRISVRIPETGQYLVRFNDTTGEYAFIRADGNLPPVARAGPDLTVGIGAIVVLNAKDSYDPDGHIVSYAWSNGMSGMVASMTFDIAGVFELVLTVTDNSGNTSEDVLTITVVNEMPQSGDWRDRTIYSLIISRFYNGDSENDFHCRERIDKNDPHWRGDLRGLIEKLDYIKDLGFSAICINPPVENRGALDFEGYNAYDWKTIDPRILSSDTTYHDFIQAAHEKGFKVIQSVVFNHSSNYGIRNRVFVDRLPIKFYRKSEMSVPWPYVFNFGNYKHTFRMDNDNPKAPAWFQDYLCKDPWGAGPLTDPKTGTVLPKDDFDADRFFGTDETLLDPYWYRQNGWLNRDEEYSAESWQKKHLDANSLDLRTENWLVKQYFIDSLKLYIDLGIDGIRIDFAGNVDRNEIFPLVDHLKEIKPELYVIADVEAHGSGFGQISGDPYDSKINPWWYTRTGNDPKNPESGEDSGIAVLDYPLFEMFSGSVAMGHFGGMEDLIAYDWVYGDPSTLVTFFHNRMYGPGEDSGVRFTGEDWRAAIAYNLLWTIRGIPCLFYGEEVGFRKGGLLDLSRSGQLLADTGKAYFGDQLELGNIDALSNHPLFGHIRRLNQIRSRIPALRKGLVTNGRGWTSGMSFVRDWQNGLSYAVIGLAAFVDQSISVERVRPGIYRDAISGLEQTVASASRTITFDVKANSAGIWVLNGPGKIGDDGAFLKP